MVDVVNMNVCASILYCFVCLFTKCVKVFYTIITYFSDMASLMMYLHVTMHNI